MPGASWESRCGKGWGDKKGKRLKNTCTVRTSVPTGTPVHLVHVFLVHTLFLFPIRTEQPCFTGMKIKGSEIRKILSDSVFKIHGIKMVGTVNRVYGFIGYFTISTQIPRNRENGRCHS